jgi:hypothetical protein
MVDPAKLSIRSFITTTRSLRDASARPVILALRARSKANHVLTCLVRIFSVKLDRHVCLAMIGTNINIVIVFKPTQSVPLQGSTVTFQRRSIVPMTKAYLLLRFVPMEANAKAISPTIPNKAIQDVIVPMDSLVITVNTWMEWCPCMKKALGPLKGNSQKPVSTLMILFLIGALVLLAWLIWRWRCRTKKRNPPDHEYGFDDDF